MADNDSIQVVSRDDNENVVGNPIFVQLSDGTAAIGTTGDAIHVNLQNVDIEVVQPIHDDLNANVTLQVADTDVSNVNPVPVSDAGGSITVDALQLDIDNLNKNDDEVLIWANTAKDGTGTDYVPLVDIDGHLQVDVLTMPSASFAGTRIHDYQTDAAVAAAASVNHDYSAAGGAFLLDKIVVSSSGASKAEIEIGQAGLGVPKLVVFIPSEGGTKEVKFDPQLSVPNTEEVRIVHTNRNKNKAQDLYSTTMGQQQ